MLEPVSAALSTVSAVPQRSVSTIIADPHQIVFDLPVSRGRHGLLRPQQRRTAEVQRLAVRRPGGIGLQPLLVGQGRTGLDLGLFDIVVEDRRVQIDHVMDFRPGVVKELPDVVEGVGDELAAGVPGGVAELLADFIDSAIMPVEGGAGKGHAAHAEENLVRTVADEAVAVGTPIPERPRVEHNGFFEALDVPLTDSHRLGEVGRGGHGPVDQIRIDWFGRNDVGEGLVLIPGPGLRLHADIDIQFFAGIVGKQISPPVPGDCDFRPFCWRSRWARL